jgi:GTP-binding protein
MHAKGNNIIMEIKKANFLKSATEPSQFPNYPYPEFAFIGRSNVGKSSLIKLIFDGRVLVKTSGSPGHTQTVNFFTINDALSIADLPGYGFAKAPGAIRKTLTPMIQNYLMNRPNLRIVFLLIDARRSITDDDTEFIHLLSYHNISTAIVLTKSDKLTQKELSEHAQSIAKELGITYDDLFITSSTKKRGRKEILSLIEEHSARI